MTGCGSDVELKVSKDFDGDYSNHEGYVITPENVAGTALDKEYAGKFYENYGLLFVNHLRSAPSQEVDVEHLNRIIEKSKSFENTEFSTQYIAEFEKYRDGIVAYNARLKQANKDISDEYHEQHKELFEQRDALVKSLAKLRKDIAPYQDVVSDLTKRKNVAEDQFKEKMEDINKMVSNYITQNEIPVDTDKVWVSNSARVRPMQECVNALIQPDGGCYKLGFKLIERRVSLPDEHRAKLNEMITAKYEAMRPYFVEATKIYTDSVKAEETLEKYQTIAENKAGGTVRSIKQDISTTGYNLSRRSRQVFKSDMTIDTNARDYKSKLYAQINSFKEDLFPHADEMYTDKDKLEMALNKELTERLIKSMKKVEMTEDGFNWGDSGYNMDTKIAAFISVDGDNSDDAEAIHKLRLNSKLKTNKDGAVTSLHTYHHYNDVVEAYKESGIIYSGSHFQEARDYSRQVMNELKKERSKA